MNDQTFRTLRIITGVGGFIGLLLIAVQAGWLLEYHGASMWLVVFALVACCVIARQHQKWAVWHLSWINARAVLVALTLAMALLAWNGGSAREEAHNQGADDRLVAAMSRPGADPMAVLASVDEVALGRLEPRIPDEVGREMKRRARKAEVDGAAYAEAQQRQREANEEALGHPFSTVWGTVGYFVGLIGWLVNPTH